MGGMKKKARMDDEDRISKLSNDLIHHIMSFMDIQCAVQTSVLSKRWKLVWTTLPFLSFGGYLNDTKESISSIFMDQVFCRRNRRSPIITLEVCPDNNAVKLSKMKKYVKYAISRRVTRLNLKSKLCCSLSLFRSESLKELQLEMKVEYQTMVKSNSWSLPNLTTLHLKSYQRSYKIFRRLPESCLMCLPALTTLGLDHLELPGAFCLPSLTRLRLNSCTLPKNIWDFPALLTLDLFDVVFPENMSDYFLALTSLLNLTIDFHQQCIGCCVISSSELVTLTIKVSKYNNDLTKGKIVVLAPKLCDFNAIGFFRIRIEGSELENIYIRFWDSYSSRAQALEGHVELLKVMFTQLGRTKALTLDLTTLKALSEISDALVHLRSPFYNLKYLKLPYGCDESIISGSVRQYILSGSPRTTIIKTLFQDNVIHPMTPAVDIRVTEENVMGNSKVDAEKAREIEASIAGECNDQVSTFWEKSCSVLWQGHEVNSEYAALLDLIMKRYPETFKHNIIKDHKIWTVKLSMLCSSVNAFTKTSMTEVNTEMLNEYRDLFTLLQKSGFNIDWLVSHLNYIENLCELYASDPRVDNAKSKLQDLQKLNATNLTASESFWTEGTSLAAVARNIGDGLL